MLIYQEDDLLQLSKICGITGSFSRSLTKPLNQALKAANCSNILFGISNMEDFPLWEYLLSYRKKHPKTRLICIYNPGETVLQAPACQSKLDNLLDQVDIVYHSLYTMPEIPMEIAILCRKLIILNHQQETDLLDTLELMDFDDPIIKL